MVCMDALAELKRKILRERGLDCERFKESFFVRRVMSRLRTTGQPSIRAYLRWLDQEPGEYARLFDALSINVTQFFRDETTFQLIQDTLLPTLLADKSAARSHTLRIWSAGCATGEEAYSLAALLAAAMRHAPAGLIAHVYGTDIDPGAVAQARRGVYEAAALAGVAHPEALGQFTQAGVWRASPALRQLVRFKVHDLTHDRPLRYIDLLLCRNVLIYFARQTQERLLATLHAALNPDGFLVLGKTESITAEAKARFIAVDIKERIYRKPAQSPFFHRGQ